MEIQQSLGGGAQRNFPLKGFTLAEVLITLGVIGVVAALTMPTLIKKYTNHVVETRLKAFYSQFNEAIKLAEAEYGDKKDWYFEIGENLGNYDIDVLDEWFMKYIGKNLKIIKTERFHWGGLFYYLANGSSFGFYNKNTRDLMFFPGNFKKCLKAHNNTYYETIGYCSFIFNYMPIANNEEWHHNYNKGLEPWKYNWDGTEESLKTNCAGSVRAFCSTWIQHNNWTIPEDYPYPVGMY